MNDFTISRNDLLFYDSEFASYVLPGGVGMGVIPISFGFARIGDDGTIQGAYVVMPDSVLEAARAVADEWVITHILDNPTLKQSIAGVSVTQPDDIAGVTQMILDAIPANTTLATYIGAYDKVALDTLWGGLSKCPREKLPSYTYMDFASVVRLAGYDKIDHIGIPNRMEHHALADALQLAEAYVELEKVHADNESLRRIMTTRPR